MITEVNQIDTSTEEGKMLMAALAIITTEIHTDKTPDEVIRKIHNLKHWMFTKQNAGVE
jgi:hypothetical protein